MKYALSVLVVIVAIAMVLLFTREEPTDAPLKSAPPLASSSASSSSSAASYDGFTVEEKQAIEERQEEAGLGTGAIMTDADAVNVLMHLERPLIVPVADIERDTVKNVLAHNFSRTALLRDVRRGGGAYGNAKAESTENSFIVLATFLGLPQLAPGQSFEGWLIQTEPFAYFSVGPLQDLHGIQTILFSSKEPFNEFDRFMLTIETDGDDPAPGEHVLEGTFEHDPAVPPDMDRFTL